MPTPELQQECKRRGLPSGRAKADLVARLVENDAAGEQGADDDFADSPTVAEPDVDLLRDVVIHDVIPAVAPPPEVAVSPQVEPVLESAPEKVPPTFFRRSFPARQEGPSEQEHLDYRRLTREGALDAGLSPRGDGRRIGTVDGFEVYEVSIRRAG